MSVIRCSHCGKDLPSEAKFCPYCMERISETVIVKLPAKKKKLNKKSIIIIIIALVLVLLLAVGTALFSHFSEDKNDDKGKGTTQSTNSTESTSLNNSTAENEPSISKDDDVSQVISIKDAFSIVNDKKDESTSTQSNNSTSTTNGTTTESNKNNSVSECEHNWVAITKTVHHDEVGHYETVENQRKVTKYKCPVCYEKFTSLDEYYSHFDSTHKPSYDGDPIKALRNQYTTESGYEYYETKEWIVDKKAYDETVVTGYKCSICQEEKE